MHDQFRSVPIEKLLARVVAARVDGRLESVQGEWHACIARGLPRVQTVVRRYVAKGWVERDDFDDVVQEGMWRAARNLVNLDALTEGTFFAGMVTASDFACRDWARARLARRRHEAGSLDEVAAWSDGDADAPGRHDSELARDAHEQAERDEQIADAERRLDDAIAKLPDQRKRTVIMLKRLGVSDEEAAAQLGIDKVNTLHAIRSRTLKELKGLIEP